MKGQKKSSAQGQGVGAVAGKGETGKFAGFAHGYGCGCIGCGQAFAGSRGTTMTEGSNLTASSDGPTAEGSDFSESGETFSGTAPTVAAAGTSIGAVSNSTYTVGDSTLAGVAKTIEGREWAGYTKGDASFSGSTLDGKITSATVNVSISKTMPVWSKKDDAPEAEQTEWQRFWNALNYHEDDHVSIMKKDASTGEGWENTHKLLEGQKGTDAEQIVKDHAASVQKANDKYDDETQHGITQETPYGTTVIDTNPGGSADEKSMKELGATESSSSEPSMKELGASDNGS